VAKLNRNEVLRELLQTLVDGWGRNAVAAALTDLGICADLSNRRRAERPDRDGERERGAFALIAELELAPDRKVALSELAARFDEGIAFPKTGDIRRFLLAHQQNAAELEGRVAAFKRMLPVLSGMSPKGLEKLIARSHHSGPAELAAISEAIRGAGEELRGKPQALVERGGKKDAEPAEDAIQSEFFSREDQKPPLLGH
jgi:hypothetical protein